MERGIYQQLSLNHRILQIHNSVFTIFYILSKMIKIYNQCLINKQKNTDRFQFLQIFLFWQICYYYTQTLTPQYKITLQTCQQTIIVMTHNLGKKIKDQVTKFDLFNHSQFLRYRAESQYKSFNGGMCSLAIIICFIIIFALEFSDVINKTDITSTTTMRQEKDPSVMTINSSKLFFAIGVSYGYSAYWDNLDLNDKFEKYFDFLTYNLCEQTNGSCPAPTFNLIPCSREAWVSAYPDIGDTFDRLQLQKWLCIEPNMTFTFQGTLISQIFKWTEIKVYACNASNSINISCKYQQFLENITKASVYMSLNTYFINPLINANDQNYLQSYLETKNSFQFSNITGTQAEFFFSNYNIQSDVSLLPTIDIVQDSGFIIYEPVRNYPKPVNSGYTMLIRLTLKKSSLSIQITRTFVKYLDFFSYIGGLFGALMSAFFIIGFLNESAFQIEIASQIYTQTKEEKIKSNHFNILTFFVHVFYRVIHYLGANPEWKLFKQFNNVRQQMSKQLDINLLLKKIRFLQDCMEYLFQDFQLKCLHLKDKHTLDQAAENRRKFSSRSFFLKLKKKRMKQEQNNKNPPNQKMDPPKTYYELNSLELMMEKRRGQLTTSKQHLSETPHQFFQQKKEYSKSIVMQQKEQPRQRQIMTRLQELPNDSDRYQQAHIDDDQSSQDLSSLDENEQKQLYQNVVDSINTLKDEASKGKPRCVEIFNSLDQVIKQVAGIPKQQIIKSDFSLLKPQSRLQKLS